MKHTLTIFTALLFAPVAALSAGDGYPDFSWARCGGLEVGVVETLAVPFENNQTK